MTQSPRKTVTQSSQYSTEWQWLDCFPLSDNIAWLLWWQVRLAWTREECKSYITPLKPTGKILADEIFTIDFLISCVSLLILPGRISRLFPLSKMQSAQPMYRSLPSPRSKWSVAPWSLKLLKDGQNIKLSPVLCRQYDSMVVYILPGNSYLDTITKSPRLSFPIWVAG